MNGTDLLIAVAGGLGVSGDQSAIFQFLNVACQGAVCNIQVGSQVIHIHSIIFLKKSDDFYADIGAKCLKDINSVLQ